MPTARPHADARIRALVLVVVALAFTLAGWAWGGRPPADQLQFGADQALLVRDALDVQQGTPPALGAYSKSGVNHPGPAYQWLLAFVLATCGDDIVRATMVLSLIQWGTLGLMIAAVHAATGSILVATATVIVVLVNPTFAIYARMLWNPSIVFPAFAAAILVTLRIAAGRTALLPLLGALVTLMIQAHAATLPVAGVLLALGTWWSLVAAPTAQQGASREQRAPRWRPAAALTITLLVLWFPPLLDAARNSGGNLGSLATLGGQERGWHPAAHVIRTLESIVAEALPGAWSGVLVLCALAIAMLGWRGHSTEGRRAVVLVVTAILAFVVSVAAVPGEIETYYLRYATLLLPLVLGLAWHGLAGLSSSRAWTAGVSALLLLAATTVAWQARPWAVVPEVLRAPVVTPFPLSDVGAAATIVRNGLTSARGGAIQTRMAERRSVQPCPFTADADVAFAVGQAVAQMVGCDVSRPTESPRYRIASLQAPADDAAIELLAGRSFRLLLVALIPARPQDSEAGLSRRVGAGPGTVPGRLHP